MTTRTTIHAFTTPDGTSLPGAEGCCSTAEQAVCCEPADKADCCGAPAPAGGSGCGCR
jgi:hypothetical protein